MNVNETYDNIFIEVFNLDKESFNSDVAYRAIPLWDSIGHMRLIAQVEGEFNIMMETEDILDFNSYKKGKEILKKYDIIFE